MQIVKSNVETLYRPIPNAAASQPRWYKSRQRGIVNSIMRYGQFLKSPVAGRGVHQGRYEGTVKFCHATSTASCQMKRIR